MFHGPSALQRRLDRLPALLGYRRRPSAVDRDRAARGIWVGVYDRYLHPFVRHCEHRHDNPNTRLYEPRHPGGARLANIRKYS